MKFPDVEIRKTLFVGEGNATVPLGLGKAQIRGGAYVSTYDGWCSYFWIFRSNFDGC